MGNPPHQDIAWQSRSGVLVGIPFSLALWRRHYRQFKCVQGLQTSTLDSGDLGMTVIFPSHSCNTPNEVQVVEGVGGA